MSKNLLLFVLQIRMRKTLRLAIFHLFKAVQIELSDETGNFTVAEEMGEYFLLKFGFVEYDNFGF